MQEWKPFPKQEQALLVKPSEAFEVFFGGARGPGKTDCGIVWLLGDNLEKDKLYIDHPRYRALVLRKNYDDLVDWIDRASFLYHRYGAEVVGKPAEVRWPSGAKFRLGHLKDRASYEKYLGHEYQRMLIEELTLIPYEKFYINIIGSCRTSIPELGPQIFLTSNPTGVGHLWVKERFIDPAPPGNAFVGEDGRGRIYIPGTIEDNPVLLQDKGYLLYLDGLKKSDPDLYRAWRHGDWDVFAGQFFKEFRRDKHIVKSFTPKSTLRKIGGIDWGYTAPFVFLASVVQRVVLEKGLEFSRVWTYREICGTEKKPKSWAQEIKETINLSEFDYIRADPSMFHKTPDGSVAISDQMKPEWGEWAWKLKPANNDRIGGWATLHNWLSLAPDGLPYWMIGENCVNLIRTLPTLVHDENKVEDIDTDGEDHFADAARYKLMHLKWIDASLGAVRAKIAPMKYKPVLETKDGGVLSIDTDEFAKVSAAKKRDWRTI